MNIEKFSTSLIIEEGYHYPFQVAHKNIQNKTVFEALALGKVDVRVVYNHIKNMIGLGSTHLLLSLDFPPLYDIETDFIAIAEWQNKAFSVFILPYDAEGNKGDIIKSGTAVDALLNQINAHCRPTHILKIETK